MWFEYLDEIEDLIEQPLYGTVEIRDPAVDGVLAMHEGGTAYGQLSRKRRSQTEVAMSVEEMSDYRELLRLVTEPVDWRGSTEGSRRWRAIAKRAIRGYFYAAEETPAHDHQGCTTQTAVLRFVGGDWIQYPSESLEASVQGKHGYPAPPLGILYGKG